MRGRNLPGLDSANPLFPDFAESASPSSMSSSDIPWAARSFLPYALQTLSRSIHSTVADQILAPFGVRATSPECSGSGARLPFSGLLVFLLPPLFFLFLA